MKVLAKLVAIAVLSAPLGSCVHVSKCTSDGITEHCRTATFFSSR